MASATNYLRAKLIDHVLRNTPYTPPATIYVALFTSATDETGAGTEVVAGGHTYARQAITFSAPAGTGNTSNTATVTFTDWPGVTATHYALMDANVAGNMLFQAPLSTPLTVAAGSNLVISIADVGVQAR